MGFFLLAVAVVLLSACARECLAMTDSQDSEYTMHSLGFFQILLFFSLILM